MSWWSDHEPFDEYEGCELCNFNHDPSRRRCEHCRTGDFWNYYDWDKHEELNGCEDEDE